MLTRGISSARMHFSEGHTAHTPTRRGPSGIWEKGLYDSPILRSRIAPQIGTNDECDLNHVGPGHIESAGAVNIHSGIELGRTAD
jgi:hypothetical protein